MIYKTIEELTTVVTGGTPSTSKAEYWENGNIPWLQSGCCQNCDVNQADKFISQSGYDNSSTQVMPVNTVMIALTGATAGKVGYLNIEACGNQSITGIFPCEELNPRFLFYFLISQRRKILVDCVGGAQAHISQGYVKKIKVPVYSKNIQERIVNIMNICSKNIKHYEMILKEYDELVKARFVEMFGDVRENSNEFEIVQFNDIVEYMGDIGSNGANKVVVNHLDMKDEEDYAIMVRFTNFTKNDFKNDVKYVSKDAYDFFKKSQIFGGELIVCKIGSAGQNYVMPYLNRPVSLGLNQIMIRIKDIILMPYLYQYLHTDYGEFLISGCINGAVTKSITKTELKKIPILLPPMEFQQRFVDFVRHVDKSRFDIKKSIIELEREVVYD